HASSCWRSMIQESRGRRVSLRAERGCPWGPGEMRSTVGAQPSREKPEAAEQEHQDDDQLEQAGVLEIDLQVEEDPREHQHPPREQQKPADDRAAVEEEDQDAEDERHESQPEGV